MRIGISRSDRIGFVVFIVLASLLAVLLISNRGDGSTEFAQEVETFADIAPAQAVPTTAAIEMPEPAATAEPVTILPAAAPIEDEPEDEEPVEVDEPAEQAEASTTEGDTSDDEASTETASAGTGETQSEAAAPAAAPTETGDVPNPQPATDVPNPQPATDVPNPQPATDVPNPQPATDVPNPPPATDVPNPQPATDVPNPQPATDVPNPQPATDVPNPQPATASAASAPATVPADAPAGGTFTRTLTATVSRPTLHTTPGGPQFTPTFNGTALPAVNPTVFGNALVYRVLAGEPGDPWAKVYVPARPNGTTAWVQTSQFNWSSSNRMLQINVSTNTVTVFEGNNVLLTTAAVLGKSSSPTPRANGWVEEIMAGPSAAYGPRLISLGIYSDALNSFGGSVPKIALHGTNNPGLMGQYASNGCIRVPNDVISQIAGMMPIGSKVQIVG